VSSLRSPATTDQDAPAARRRRGSVRKVPRLVWLFLLIPLGVELAWVFWPAINSFSLSFTRWSGVGAAENIGLDNYRNLLDDPIFRTAIGNTVIWTIGFGGLSVLIGLALAVALNKPRRGVGLYRSAIYLPMVFSLVVTGLFWRVMYQPDGAINSVFDGLGLDALSRQWLADPDTALYAVLIAAVWRQVGYIMVLYLAGLKSCDPALQDASAVDGLSMIHPSGGVCLDHGRPRTRRGTGITRRQHEHACGEPDDALPQLDPHGFLLTVGPRSVRPLIDTFKRLPALPSSMLNTRLPSPFLVFGVGS
jgi:ABC-type polysaccharide transport system permease subunit